MPGLSAVDEYGAVSNRSNHNESIWIAAPGVRVSTTSHRGGYTEESGCSYAVPHVAGAAAILKSMDADLTPEGIRTMLSENAADRGIEGYDEYYGWGILNLSGCVGALPGEEDSPREISMCARDSACPLADFTDLDRSAWYHDGLHYVLAAGMMDGAGNGVFLPDALIDVRYRGTHRHTRYYPTYLYNYRHGRNGRKCMVRLLCLCDDRP